MRKSTVIFGLLILCFLATIFLGLGRSKENLCPIGLSAKISQPEDSGANLSAVKRKVHGYVKNWGQPNAGAYMKLFVDWPPSHPWCRDTTYYTFTNSSGYYVFDGWLECTPNYCHTEEVTCIALGGQRGQEGGSRGSCPPKTYSTTCAPGPKFQYDYDYGGFVWRQDFGFKCGPRP